MGATPELLELEDIDSGRIRRVERTDPNLDIGSGKDARTSQDPTDEQASR